MIAGRVNSDLEALVELTLVNSRDGSRRTLTAVIDTGFNGFLTLHPDLLGELNAERRGRGRAKLANGQFDVFDIFAVDVLWDGEQRTVEADAAEAEPLIGMELLRGFDLSSRVVPGGTMTIEGLA